MRQAARLRLEPCIWLLGALAILPAVVRAQADWIDEFPHPTQVAHAAFEELKIQAYGTVIDDPLALDEQCGSPASLSSTSCSRRPRFLSDHPVKYRRRR